MYNILKFSNGATIYQYSGKVRRHDNQISDEDMVEIAKDFLSRLQPCETADEKGSGEPDGRQTEDYRKP